MPAIDASLITGLVLAGGQGSRMGGLDKGLQLFNGTPLALNAIQRLTPQVGPVMLSANRHAADYAAFGVPVWADDTGSEETYAGPLAGFAAGLQHCVTPYLLTVPCDAPRFPLDLAQRLAAALTDQATDLAIALAPENGKLWPQPVFCLMHTRVRVSLEAFMQSGGRKIGAWVAQLNAARVAFDRPGDDTLAFFNANTLDELRALEAASNGSNRSFNQNK